MLRISLISVVALQLFAPAVAQASGVRVEKWLTLPELVRASKIVIVGRVVRPEHLRNRRRAYGRSVAYVATYRLRVVIEKVLRGPRALRGKTMLLIKSAPGVPGRWTIVRRAYRESLALASVEKGQRLIGCVTGVFGAGGLKPTGGEPPALRLLAALPQEREPDVAKLLPRRRGNLRPPPPSKQP